MKLSSEKPLRLLNCVKDLYFHVQEKADIGGTGVFFVPITTRSKERLSAT